jgi:hypothetical protein
MAYDANKPADNDFVSAICAFIRENFRAIINDKLVNADKLDDLHAANTTGAIPISNGTLNVNLNADMLEGLHAGNETGKIPVSNGTKNVNLNAAMLEGLGAADFVRKDGSTVMTGNCVASSATAINFANAAGPVILASPSDTHLCSNCYFDRGTTAWKKYNDATLSVLVYAEGSTGGVKMYYSAAGSSNPLQYGPFKVWNETNDGPGSGLDADTVDGIQAADIIKWVPGMISANFSSTKRIKVGELPRNQAAGDNGTLLFVEVWDGVWTGAQNYTKYGVSSRGTRQVYTLEASDWQTTATHSIEFWDTGAVLDIVVAFAAVGFRNIAARGFMRDYVGTFTAITPVANYDTTGKTQLSNEAQANSIRKAVFTATDSFTPPAGVFSVRVTGSGGGGGGGGSNHASYGGGGGGGGQFCISAPFSVTPGTTYTVTIGLGGNGGNINPTDGTAGGTTSLGSVVSLAGGSGGGAGNSSTFPGAGGSGAGALPATFYRRGSDGAYGTNGSTTGITGGSGGSSFSAGAVETNRKTGSGTTGQECYGYGGGGSGGCWSAGGKGGDGFLMIEW